MPPGARKAEGGRGVQRETQQGSGSIGKEQLLAYLSAIRQGSLHTEQTGLMAKGMEAARGGGEGRLRRGPRRKGGREGGEDGARGRG